MPNSYILNKNINSNNYFINFLQLFFFNKPLYSFFNVFCRNGKKGLTLKLVLLLLANLKSKTLISPIIILKSVILNNKLFFKVNETKFKKRSFYSVSHLDLGHQVSYSIGNLNRYLKEITLDAQHDLVDTLSNFFLSFFFKDNSIYKNYINKIVVMNESINEVFSDLEEHSNRYNSVNKLDRLYVNTLLSKYKGKGTDLLVVNEEGLQNTAENLPVSRNRKKLGYVGRSKHRIKHTIDEGKSNFEIGSDIYGYNNLEHSLNNLSLVDNDLNSDPIGHLDIADININQYFKNYSSLKNKIIYFFLCRQLNNLYYLIESVYSRLFNLTMDSIYEESLFDKNFSDEFILIDEKIRKEGPKVGKQTIFNIMEYFMLRAISVELQLNVGIQPLHFKKSDLQYKWMLYESKLLSYVHRYQFNFHKLANNFTGENKNIDEIVLNDHINEDKIISIYRKNILNIFRNYVRILKRIREEKKRRTEIIKKFKQEEEGKKIISNIKNSLRKKVLFNISMVINKILPYFIKQLRYDSSTLNYRKNRKYISYKFKRRRVIGYY